ncbi:MAG: hypothetical protein KKA35_03730 [Proteobacteria bacterium]|nr:hypothetical protein [Pseudomonadota bacterium]
MLRLCSEIHVLIRGDLPDMRSKDIDTNISRRQGRFGEERSEGSPSAKL